MDSDHAEWIAKFRGTVAADFDSQLDQAEIHYRPLFSTLGAIRSSLGKPPTMAAYNVVFEVNEVIFGVVPRANDWVEYSCVLKIEDGGKLPVSLEMSFIPPHPFSVNMPLAHTIRAASISGLYFKVIAFLGEYGVEFRG